MYFFNELKISFPCPKCWTAERNLPLNIPNLPAISYSTSRSNFLDPRKEFYGSKNSFSGGQHVHIFLLLFALNIVEYYQMSIRRVRKCYNNRGNLLQFVLALDHISRSQWITIQDIWLKDLWNEKQTESKLHTISGQHLIKLY